MIKRDQADVIIAGGTESVMMPVMLAGFCAMRALADGRDDPAPPHGRSTQPDRAS